MVIKKVIQQNELAKAIVAVLSQAPARAGLRLRSEPVLARHLKVQRWRVREIFNQLEAQGILIRRKGSGTYLRKVPHFGEVGFAESPMGKLVRQYLFYDEDITESETAVPLKPTPTQACLHLAVWGVSNQTPVQRYILLTIKKRAVERGHYLTIHSTSSTPDKPFSVEELKARFKDNHADGYIIASMAAENILQAMGPSHAPVMFFHGSNIFISHEPVVVLDIEDMIIRGIRTLADQGYRRIAVIGLNSVSTTSGSIYQSTEHIYNHTMADLSLDYRQTIFCHHDESAAIKATQQLLESSTPPDAVCVTDDYVMVGVARALMASSQTPGRDFGVICLGNSQISPALPGPIWSRIEFDLQWYGQLIVDTLLRFIQSAGNRVGNLKIMGNWHPGQTHLRDPHLPDSNALKGDSA